MYFPLIENGILNLGSMGVHKQQQLNANVAPCVLDMQFKQTMVC